MNILESLLQPVVFSDLEIAGMCAVALLTIGVAVFIQFCIETA